MSMQNLIIEELKGFAETNGCQLVINYKFANTGKAWIMDGLSKKVGFYFDFQRDYCSLQFYPGNKEVVGTCGFTDANCFLNSSIYYGKDDIGIKLNRIKKIVSPSIRNIAKV